MDDKNLELTDEERVNFLNHAEEVLHAASELSREVRRGKIPPWLGKILPDAILTNDDLIAAKRNSFLVQKQTFTRLCGNYLFCSKRHNDFMKEFNETREKVFKEIREVEEAYKNFQQLRKKRNNNSEDVKSQKDESSNQSTGLTSEEDESDSKLSTSLSTSDKAVIGATAGTAAVAAATSVPMLVGFTNAGVAAGSLAASIQAGIGSVAAGSSFAVMQSVGATTILGGPVGLIVGASILVTGGTIIGAIKIAEHVKKRRNAEEGNEAENEEN